MTGKDVRRVRTRLQLTQAQFGKRLGVTRVTVMRWETGRVRVTDPVAHLIRFVASAARNKGG